MRLSPHRCDDGCVCPVHGTALMYWPAGDEHACQDPGCVYAHGLERGPPQAGVWSVPCPA